MGVFWYINVPFIRTEVQQLMWVSQPIGNGIFYCNLFSSGDKIVYQQVSKECIHQIGTCMLQSLALCLVPLFFLACGFSVALSKKQVFLHALIQLNDPQWGNSAAASLSFWKSFLLKLHLRSNWVNLFWVFLLILLKDLRQYLANLAEQCSADNNGADLPVVIILDNLHHIGSLSDIFNGFLNCKYNKW